LQSVRNGEADFDVWIIRSGTAGSEEGGSVDGKVNLSHLRQNPRDFPDFCRDLGKKWRECWWFSAVFVCSAIKYISTLLSLGGCLFAAPNTRNRKTGEAYFTHRLVEVVREGKAVKQRTLLNLGVHFDVARGDWAALAARIDAPERARRIDVDGHYLSDLIGRCRANWRRWATGPDHGGRVEGRRRVRVPNWLDGFQ
jgi:hypothetical protein